MSSNKEDGPSTVIVTAAELVRRRLKSDSENKTKKSKSSKAGKEEKLGKCRIEEPDDIDDEIKRLEAELAEDSSSSDSDSDSESSSSDDLDESDEDDGAVYVKENKRNKKIKFGETTLLNKEEFDDKYADMKHDVICASKCAEDAIAPLPITALPTCKSKKLKIDLDNDEEKNLNDGYSNKTNKKRKRSSNKISDNNNDKKSDGLRQAVLEVLQGYIPRSSERIPFYCRVCSHQSANEKEFNAHKTTEFHKTAVQVEKKKTYCKLCRKQLTSIVQMQEHLQSKPHRERMDFVKARQSGGTNNRQRDRRSHWGRGNEQGRGGGGLARRDQWQQEGQGNNNRRQWC